MKNLSNQFKALFLLVLTVFIGITYSCKYDEKEKLKDLDNMDLRGMFNNLNIDMTSKFKRSDVDVNKLFSKLSDEFYDTDLPEVNDAKDTLVASFGANIMIGKDTITVVPFDDKSDFFPIDKETANWDVYGICETKDCFKQKMQEIAKVSESKCMEVRITRDKNNSKVYGEIVECD